jgi:1-deoxy-D-xylulose-5-phosphate synthase
MVLIIPCAVSPYLEAGKVLGGSVIDMRFVKPLDEQLISQIANSHQQLISIEDNVI